MSKKMNPGTKAPASAQYEVIGPRGGHTGKEVTSVKGEPLPPTRTPGGGYIISDQKQVRTRVDECRVPVPMTCTIGTGPS